MADVMLQADADAVFTGYKSRVEDTYAAYKSTLQQYLADPPETSSMEREAYVISALNANMTRWRGDRDYTDLMRLVKYVENDDPFQIATTLQAKDLELRTKALSQLQTTAKMHGKAAAARPDDLCRDRLQDGVTTAWVDGVNFFSTTHPENPFDSGNANTWANYNAARNLTATTYEACIEEMMSYLGWDQQPVELEGFQLIVPPALWAQAKQIVEAERVVGSEASATGGNTNVNRGTSMVRVSTKLANEPTAWYMAAKVQGIIPGLVLQEWRSTRVRRLGAGSDADFERDEVKMGVDRGIECAHLWPWCIYRNN